MRVLIDLVLANVSSRAVRIVLQSSVSIPNSQSRWFPTQASTPPRDVAEQSAGRHQTPGTARTLSGASCIDSTALALISDQKSCPGGRPPASSGRAAGRLNMIAGLHSPGPYSRRITRRGAATRRQGQGPSAATDRVDTGRARRARCRRHRHQLPASRGLRAVTSPGGPWIGPKIGLASTPCTDAPIAYWRRSLNGRSAMR
jgi:hypothetical protein